MRGSLELEAQDVGRSAFFGFDDGVGVMGDKPTQHGVGVLRVAQVTRAVERVQAGMTKPCRPVAARSRVAWVMQPRGGFQQNRRQRREQAPCPHGNALDVRLAAGEWHLEERLGEMPALYRQLMALTWFSTVADAAGK